jgi:hypothetical protein
VVVNVMKKAGELPQWESDGLDTMFWQNPADVVEGDTNEC